MTRIEFYVNGEPKSAGSKRAFMVGKKGGPKRPILVDTCKNEDWKTAVRAAAVAAHKTGLLRGPIYLRVVFWMLRPKSHYNSKGQLKAGAPQWHTKKPDATKLLRCLEDCLKGIVWIDDSEVAEQCVKKPYCSENPGAAVIIEEMNP